MYRSDSQSRRIYIFATVVYVPWNAIVYLMDCKICLILNVPDTGIGCCLGPEGNGVSSGEGGEGGPGPPDKKQDKQSTPSKERDNMEQEEEGKKSQA